MDFNPEYYSVCLNPIEIDLNMCKWQMYTGLQLWSQGAHVFCNQIVLLLILLYKHICFLEVIVPGRHI